MLTFADLCQIVSTIESGIFDQQFVFRVSSFQAVREGRDEADVREDDVWFVQARMYRPDFKTGEMAWGAGRKEFISPTMIPDEVEKTCLVMAIAFVEHEIRENFRVDGLRPFGPHASTKALRQLDKADVVAYRDPPPSTVLAQQEEESS